jgi:N-dimethylarginine dimethylaminohydrolase
MVDAIGSILIKHPRDAFIDQEHLNRHWQAFNYTQVPDFDRAVREFSLFEQALGKWVPEILYLPFDGKVGMDSIYTHDSVKITRHGAVYFPMGKPLRQQEGAAMQACLEGMGIRTLGHIRGKGKMEGGDLVWLDDQSVAIGLGYRTNQEGIDQFAAMTRSFIKEMIVVPLPHADGPSACLHLMSLISMVDHDLAVVYLKYMPVFFKELLERRGITLLDVSEEEYDRLGSNVLALGPRKCLMLEGNPGIQGRLEQAGAEVLVYPGDDLSIKGTGGPTCLTQPILRTPDTE